MQDVNRTATKVGARNVLKRYRRLTRIAGRKLPLYKSPLLDGTPPQHTNVNGTEHVLINRISKQQEAETTLEQIDRALCLLPELSRTVLVLSYCITNELTEYNIADKVGIASDKSVDYYKCRALIEFAEAYNAGELLVFNE